MDNYSKKGQELKFSQPILCLTSTSSSKRSHQLQQQQQLQKQQRDDDNSISNMTKLTIATISQQQKSV